MGGALIHTQWIKQRHIGDFALHAWLNNWDAVGAGSENPMDNIKLKKDAYGAKEAVLVDAGGALDYKGMGGSGKKKFTIEADEWDTLRDPAINPTMAKVFGGMTSYQLKESAKKLKWVTNDDVKGLVDKYHNGTSLEKSAMTNTLINRRDAILKKAGVDVPSSVAAANAASSSKPKIDTTPATSKVPVSIAPPPTAKYPAGIGKKMNAVYEAAKKGDIKAVEAVAANPNSTASYTKKLVAYKKQHARGAQGRQGDGVAG